MKAGYKQTEIGLIPDNWNIISIRDAQLDISDGNYSSKYPSSQDFQTFGVPFIRANNIKNMIVVDTDMRHISANLHSELLKGHLKANDILITTRGEIGQIAIVPDRHIGSNINAQLVRLGSSNSKFNFRYLAYYLLSDRSQSQLQYLQTGSALKQLPVNRLKQLLLVAPPLPEQQAIAEALSDVDLLIASLDQLIEKRRALKTATMQQLLTGKTRLAGFSGDWETKRLGEATNLQNGYAFKSNTYSEFGDYKIITISNVQDGYLDCDNFSKTPYLPTDLQPHQKLKLQDILISMTGNVGRVCRVSATNCLLNQRVGKLSAERISDEFLFHTLKDQVFIKTMIDRAKGGAQPNLSSSDILSYEFRCPADIAEQQAIAEVLSDMDAELTELAHRRDKTIALKQGMMQELLTGRTRLI